MTISFKKAAAFHLVKFKYQKKFDQSLYKSQKRET